MKKIKNTIILIMMMMSGWLNIFSQSTQGTVIPPSPKASSIIRYGEYPVSLYTGLVDISVPVYAIDIKGIKVPVEFKYHASGIKYDDKSLEAGLGWTLMAGGVITCSPRGNTDPGYSVSSGYIPFQKSKEEIDPTSDYCSDYNPVTGGYNDNYFMRRISQGESSSIATVDGESDIYSYSFLQYSGKFFYQYDNFGNYNPNNYSRQPVFSPANSLRLITESGGIELADKEGIRYFFTELERGAHSEIYHSQYLTRIVSADRRDTVYFNYTKFSPAAPYLVSRPAIKSGYVINESIIYDFAEYTPYYERGIETGGLMDVRYYYPPRLNNITFRGGRIVFEYNSVRDLRFVKIYNDIQAAPLQTISLEKSSFTNGEQKLDRIVFTDNDGNSYDYRFEYNGNPPAYPAGIDYWGYYNGQPASSSSVYVPSFKVNVQNGGYYTISGLNRSASEASMKLGILNKITYPTRGYTVFSYEAHRVYSPFTNGDMLYGGLRIKEILNYNSDGSLAEKKWYQYEGARGVLPPAAYQTDNAASNFIYYCTATRFLEYVNNGNYIVIKKYTTRNSYSAFPKRNAFASGSSAVYLQVTEYAENQTSDYGKTVYTFSDRADEDDPMMYRSGASGMPVRSYSWRNGQLASKKIYRKEANGQYTEIYTLINEYKDINTAEYRNLVVKQYIHAPDEVLRCFNLYQSAQYFGGESSPFDYYNYYLNTGLSVLDYSTITENGVSKRVDYGNYNSAGMPREIRTTTNSGQITENIKYPADFPGQTVYSGMVERNILSPIVEKAVYTENNQLREKTVNNYSQWHSLFYAPQTVQRQGATGGLETRRQYSYDTMGNIREVINNDAEKTVYLWGYSHQYPVAEIKNATYSQIEQILTSQLINRVASTATPAASDLTAIKNLRTNANLSGVMVTVYEYRPLVGITSVTDPRGITTYYEYDAFGRLKRTYLKENGVEKTVQSYDYHYKNQ